MMLASLFLARFADIASAAEGLAGATQLSRRPLIYRIDDFLPRDSARALIAAAEPHLARSGVVSGDPGSIELQSVAGWHQNLEHKEVVFGQADMNQDGKLCSKETRRFLSQQFNMANHNHTHLLSALKGRRLGRDEFVRFDWPGYVQKIRAKWPHLANRHSEQTWLPAHMHPLAADLVRRAAKVLKIPVESFLEHRSEPLQVVRYNRRGHYACHTDATEAYPYRRATLQVFLNDDYTGGELAFPYVDRNITDSEWEDLKTQCLPTRQCGSEALRIQAKIGDAILWYNLAGNNEGEQHLIRESTHAGCPVRKGIKWIANLWLPAP